jgi:hypothetical protein
VGELSIDLSRLYIVADPDGLLFEEGLAQEIRDIGFDILSFDDPVVFRYVYESQYRNNGIMIWQPNAANRVSPKSLDIDHLAHSLICCCV